MAMSVQYRQKEKSLGGGMMVIEKEKEKDDDLSLFLEMRHLDMEKNNNNSLLHSSEELDDFIELKPESLLISETTPAIDCSESQTDDLLSIENSKNDYEWLLAPSDNPPILSVEKKAEETATSQAMNTNARANSQQPRLAKPAAKPVTGSTNKSSNRSVTSNTGIRRPSPSRGPTSTTSRSTTPAARPTLPSTTKPSRSSTPTSRAISASSTKPTAPPKRSSTPIISSSRSSTPTPRASTPSSRPSLLTTSKTTSRSSTPTHRPSDPNGRPSSVTRPNSNTSKNPVGTRGNSPAVKSRPSKNPTHTSLDEKPVSDYRGRPSLPIVKVSSTEINSNGRQTRNSCSPSRGKLSNGNATSNNVRSSIGKARGYSDINDDVNPVLMGTKMVERVVNMRKLAPPKQDDHLSNSNNASGKSSSQDNSGFGRSLSKKSLDMALRHMDIRRSMPGNLRAMITKVPASSMYSVRSDSAKSKTTNASDSPLATSSNASSELSLSNNSQGSELGDNDFRTSEGISFLGR